MKWYGLLVASCQVLYSRVKTDNLCFPVLPLKKKVIEKSSKAARKILLLVEKGGWRRGKCTAVFHPSQCFWTWLAFLKNGQKCCPCPMVLQLDKQPVELCPCSCSEGVAASSITPSLLGSGGIGELPRGSITPCFSSLPIAPGLPWWLKRLGHGKILKQTVKSSNSVRQFQDTVKSLGKFFGKGIEADPSEVWTIKLIALSWGIWMQRWSSISMLASWRVRAGWSLFFCMYFWDELESKSLWVLLKNDILKEASWLLGFRITTEPK